MSIKSITCATAIGSLMALILSMPAKSEDTLGLVAVDCGASCAVISPITSFLNSVPGATFVINIAHLPPAPEEALDENQMPIICEPIMFRVDTLQVGAADGGIGVELGERLRIQMGEVAQIVQKIEPNGKGALPRDMDLRGFRFRAEKPEQRCSVVASGMYYASDTATPVPFALLPGSSMSR